MFPLILSDNFSPPFEQFPPMHVLITTLLTIQGQLSSQSLGLAPPVALSSPKSCPAYTSHSSLHALVLSVSLDTQLNDSTHRVSQVSPGVPSSCHSL